MGEIREKLKIQDREIEAIVDTGSDHIVVREDLLQEIGAKPVKQETASFADESKKQVNVYLEDIEIKDYKLPAVVIVGGRKNLLGRIVLQQLGAKIDQVTDTITYTRHPAGVIEITSLELESRQ
ncbi:MAG: retropepsin-like domain-containing protein [Candidatus Aenigmarchaeota archaeon]|nr:retropepsin-like domain-containing protein [Candidatus Aenigmarchaeota archaeon]